MSVRYQHMLVEFFKYGVTAYHMLRCYLNWALRVEEIAKDAKKNPKWANFLQSACWERDLPQKKLLFFRESSEESGIFHKKYHVNQGLVSKDGSKFQNISNFELWHRGSSHF